MLPHQQLEALIRAAERHFHLEKDQLRAGGGRYLPLVKFRQVVQLVAHDRGFKYYQIAKAFDYACPQGTLVKKNVLHARDHTYRVGQTWWSNTRAALAKAWEEELERAD